MEAGGGVTVGEVLALLEAWHPRLLAGKRGLGRRVSWAATMRARVPAFEGFTGGELALLSLGTLRVLRTQVETLTIAGLVDELAELGAAAVAITEPEEGRMPSPAELTWRVEAERHAESYGIPLLELPTGTPLPTVERDVIRYVVAQRERQSVALMAPAATPEVLHTSLRGEALAALLTGTYTSEALMRARASQLGFDLTQPHVILWLELSAADGGRSQADGSSPPVVGADGNARAVADALEVALGAWVRALEAEVVALLPVAGDRGLAELGDRVRELVGRALGGGEWGWSAGLGEPATAPADVRRSAEEAHAAARLGGEVLGLGHIARQSDLGVYRLLLSLRRSGELAPFVERALAPLRADRRTGDALVETLEVFFASNGNLSEAARQLHLHRNSLLYRLHRARELLGHDLDDPELRLTLQLAIKGQRVLALD
jgi:sugar diacid utilization regulator